MEISDAMSFSIAMKEGWSSYVNAQRPPRPPQLTSSKLKALSATDKALYDQQRYLWHANAGTLHTPQVERIIKRLWVVLNANVTAGQATKSAVALEGDSFLGKTTIAQTFAKDFHLRQIAMKGDRTNAGDERWPVCYVSLSGHPTVKGLNSSLLHFFAHAGAERGNADEMEWRALETFIKCKFNCWLSTTCISFDGSPLTAPESPTTSNHWSINSTSQCSWWEPDLPSWASTTTATDWARLYSAQPPGGRRAFRWNPTKSAAK